MINSELKSLGAELSAAAAQFDKQDKSEKNLSQQNKILEKSIDTEKDKLSALIAEYDRQNKKLSDLGSEVLAAKEKYSENSEEVAKAETQYAKQATAVNKLQTQINNTNGDIAKMTRQVQENDRAMDGAGQSTDEFSGDMGKAGKSAKDTGDDIEDAGKSSSTFEDVWKGSVVADAIGKVADAAKGASDEIKQLALDASGSVGTLQAKLGLTKESATDLAGVAKTVWKDNWGEDLNDVTEAVANVRQQLGNMSDNEMTQVTENAYTVQRVFGAEVPESVKVSKTMMENFGISSSQAFDLITTGYQNGLDYSGEFLDTLNEYSPQFASMGLSAADAMKLLITGSDQGAFSLDKVADAMKEFNLRIKDGSSTTQDGLKALGINYDDLMQKLGSGQMTTGQAMQLVIEKLKLQKDSVAQNQAGVNLFGTQWEDLGKTAILAMGETSDGVQDAMSTVEGATKRAGDSANNNLAANFESAKRQIMDAFEPLAAQVVSKINEMMPVLQSAVQWIVANAEPIKTAITGIGLAITTWKLSTVINEAGGFVTAIQSIGIALSANPVGAVITGIVLLGTALVTAYQKCAWFRDGVNAVFGAIGSFFHAIWDGIVIFFTQTLPNAWNTVVAFFQGIPAWWNGLWSQVGQFFTSIWNGITGFFQSIPTWWQNLWNQVGQFFQNCWNNIGNFFTQWIPNFLNSIKEWFSHLPENIGYALGYALGKLTKWGLDALAWAAQAIPQLLTSIATFFSQLPGRIWEFLTQAFTKITTWGQNCLTFVAVNFAQFVTSVVSFFQQLPAKIWALLCQAIDKIKTWGSNCISYVTTNFPKFVASVVNFFQELPGKIWAELCKVVTNIGNWVGNMLSFIGSNFPKVVSGIVGFFQSIPGKMLDIGKNIVQGIWNGISNAAGWLWNQITGFCSGIVKGFKDALGIHSPSRVMRDEVGGYIAEGVGVGFSEAMDSVTEDMAGQMAGLSKALSGTQISASLRMIPQIDTAGMQLPVTATASGSVSSTYNINVYASDINNPKQTAQEIGEQLDFLQKRRAAANGTA